MDFKNNNKLIEEPSSQLPENEKNTIILVWALHLGSIVTSGLTSVIALIISLIKKDDTESSAAKTHHEKSIHISLICLIGLLIGSITTIILVGFVILFFTVAWYYYQSIKGLIKATENRSF